MKLQISDRAVRSILKTDIAPGKVMRIFREGSKSHVAGMDVITGDGIVLSGKVDSTFRFYTLSWVGVDNTKTV